MKNLFSRRFLYVAGVAAILTVVYRMSQPSSPGNGPKEGFAAPPLRLVDISGQSVSLSQYRGQVVLLDFWATWCDTCTQELPDLKKIHAALHPRGFELLAASVDTGGRKVLMPFVAQNTIPWPVLLADADTADAYAIYALPAKFLIDPNGIIVRKYTGWTEPRELEQDIQALLNSGDTHLIQHESQRHRT